MEAGDLVPGVEEGAVGNWASMPTDVLRVIGAAIQGIEDYASFVSVCKSWRSSRFSSRWECPESSKRRLEYPCLMLVQHRRFVRRLRFYSLYRWVCVGSSCGWLLTLGLDLEMHLLNPITREQLPLPSQTTFTKEDGVDISSMDTLRRVFFRKVLVIYDEPVAATANHRRTPLVFVIYGYCRQLAMARPGDSSWTPIPHSSRHNRFIDVCSFRDQVVVYNYDQIMICHFSASPPWFEDVCAPPPPPKDSGNLVDLGGELYAVGSFPYPNPRCTVTTRFKACKLNFIKKTWEEMDTLGCWAVFLGCSASATNSTFALSCSDYPQCRPNCIYLTDCYGEEDPDLNPFPISHQLLSTYAPFLWLAPNLW